MNKPFTEKQAKVLREFDDVLKKLDSNGLNLYGDGSLLRVTRMRLEDIFLRENGEKEK